ncbi:lysoplasmalogenase, partial [Candidatus Thorarchaeota archaeon]
GVVFWVFAIVSLVLRAVAEDRVRKEIVAAIKMVPALVGLALILTVPLSTSLFHYLLAGALVFCALGDIAMEYDVVPGLGLFLVAQILFTVNFLQQTLALGTALVPIAIFAVSMGGLLIYIALYRRYLASAETQLEPRMLTAVTVYAFAISLTLGTSILFWLSATGVVLGWVLPLGSLLFVISDSVIGIAVFHHHMRGEGVIILTTYYSAIFLIALSSLYYTS